MYELQQQYEQLVEGDKIHLPYDGIDCVVLNQMKGDCVFLQQSNNHSKLFHIFYDELCGKDYFNKVSV